MAAKLPEYNKLQPPRGSNAHSTLHMDTIIVCCSNARGQIPTPGNSGDYFHPVPNTNRYNILRLRPAHKEIQRVIKAKLIQCI